MKNHGEGLIYDLSRQACDLYVLCGEEFLRF
jgi:hypothetical protein